jgi:hypothetical protein
LSDAGDPSGQGRQRKAFGGGDTLRRCDTVIQLITDRGRRAFVAASLSPLQPAASRSGED